MELLIIGTIALGMVAKYIEFKLDKSIKFEKEWVSLDELPVPEKINFQTY
jgi:hypothetical protein